MGYLYIFSPNDRALYFISGVPYTESEIKEITGLENVQYQSGGLFGFLEAYNRHDKALKTVL